MSEAKPRKDASEETPACAAFESTLALLDGAAGAQRDAACAHAEGCPVCGPLVASWTVASASIVAAFEDAAERAKPLLAGLADRVLAEVQPARPTTSKSLWDRLLDFGRLAKAPLVLAAATAAVALVLVALVKSPGTAPVQQAAAACAGEVEVDKLAFAPGTDGMVFNTATGHLTVLWVSEPPQA